MKVGHGLQADISKVVLLDDHPLMLSGLEKVINAQGDLSVVAALSRPEPLLRDDNAFGANLLVLDLLLGNRDALALLRDITRRHPKLPVVVFSMCDERVYALKSINHGARAYLMKDHSPEKLLAAMRSVLAGEIYLSEEMQVRYRQTISGKSGGRVGLESLSSRELAVFRLIGEGNGTKEIAANMGISPKTVESHRENIKRKLDILRIDKLVSEATLWRFSHGRTDLR